MLRCQCHGRRRLCPRTPNRNQRSHSTRRMSLVLKVSIFQFEDKCEPWYEISNNVVCVTSKGSDQPAHTLICSLICSITVKLLTEPHLRFLSLKGGCRGSFESTLVKMPYCWKSHDTAHVFKLLVRILIYSHVQHRGSVGRALDWGSKGFQFELHCQWFHCVVSLSKTFYPLLTTGSTQEDQLQQD